MTAASPGPHLFSVLTNEHDNLFRTRQDTFLLSLLGQAAVLALIIYFTGCVIRNPPEIARRLPDLGKFPLIFSGFNGGGGGNHDPLPASNGNPPRGSLQMQIVSPSVMVPTEMPKLPREATVMMAPDVKFPVASHLGDPSSPFSKWLSDGPGGPRGVGDGCCDGVGPDSGPYVGEGTPSPSGSQRRDHARGDLQSRAQFFRRSQKSEIPGNCDADGGSRHGRSPLQHPRAPEPGNGSRRTGNRSRQELAIPSGYIPWSTRRDADRGASRLSLVLGQMFVGLQPRRTITALRSEV